MIDIMWDNKLSLELKVTDALFNGSILMIRNLFKKGYIVHFLDNNDIERLHNTEDKRKIIVNVCHDNNHIGVINDGEIGF
jgi:hypothetical protein